MPNDSTTPRTVGDVIADLRTGADLTDLAPARAAEVMREAADLLEQCVPSSVLVPS